MAEKSEQPEPTPPAAAGTPAAGNDAESRARRHAAWRGAARTLNHGFSTASLRERLAELTELAEHTEAAPDLNEPVDIYGNGVVAALEKRVAELLGLPAAAFFPTGTMAQQVALRCWAGRTGNATVALHPRAHPEMYEEEALSVLAGLRTIHPTSQPRLPTADEVRDTGEPFGTLMLELPLRDAGFVLPTWDELTAVVEAAHERDAMVHFDGARLWESVTHFGRPLAEIAGLADSVYVSFYKSLRGLSGAALVGPEELIAEARSWRHRYGGNLFQQFPAALSALAGLERELPRLPEYVAQARMVADALAEAFTSSGDIPWFRVHPRPPHTQAFQVWLPYDAAVLTEAAVRVAEETKVRLFSEWDDAPAGPPGLSMTEVSVGAPGLEWTAADVRAAAADFVRRVVEEADRPRMKGTTA